MSESRKEQKDLRRIAGVLEVLQEGVISASFLEAFMQGFSAGQEYAHEETLERGRRARLRRDREIREDEWPYSPYARSDEHKRFQAAREVVSNSEEQD